MKKFTMVPIMDLIRIKGKDIVQIYENYYWAVSDKDEVYFYNNKAPQCNRSSRLLTSTNLGSRLPAFKRIQLIRVAFVSVDPADFA